MPSNSAHSTPGPPLLLDMRRVLSTSRDLSCRMPTFVHSNRDRAIWGDEDRTRLFTVANLVAYHVARSVGAPLADRILRAELSCLLALSRTSQCVPVAGLGLDPFLNRIRLAALTGEVDAALRGIDDCLSGRADRSRDGEDSLLYGVRLFAGSDRNQLQDLLRSEKILVAWRSGRLSAMDGKSARRLVAQCSERSAQLRVEVELRLRLGEAAPPAYSLAPGDTLKSALHRALVYVDQLDPPLEDLPLKVTLRGLERLDEMSFLCLSTPHLWARTALRWFASCAVDHVPIAEHAVSEAHTRISETAARDRKSVV